MAKQKIQQISQKILLWHTHPSWHYSEVMTPSLANHTCPNFLHHQLLPLTLAKYLAPLMQTILHSPPYLMPVLHPGPLSPITSTQPHKTAEMPNVESR